MQSPAVRRYVRRFIPLMIAYVLVLLAVVHVMNTAPPEGPLVYILAVLPALPLIGVIFVMGRLLVEESDEYLRMLLARQMLIATGVTLVICTIWGFLESFADVPHVPIYWAFVVWCFGLGVGGCVNKFTS